eukprot:TRINITY_DN10752_c0_g1_i1.p2 TRINITY_DN10752_c0_g1~~TRINITY_DN10752_c0_g1_i1.p2  ORF type:complete len:149 (-),score=39.62 TRINITY_DN10752_c0_g1_i1:134-580(-)
MDAVSSLPVDTIAYAVILVAVLYILKLLAFPASPLTPVPLAQPKKPVKMRDFTLAQLATFRGGEGKPIYTAILGKVYDVSSKPMFYGPGGSYHVFAGHDISRALATGSLKEEDVNNSSLDGLSPQELQALEEWISTFSKYPVIGRVVE